MTDLEQASERVTAAALAEARQAASERLLAWLLRSGVAVEDDARGVTEVLLRRDEADPRFQVLISFAERWALDIVTITTAALVPRRGQQAPRTPDVLAIESAIEAGASWAAIGTAIGIAAPTAHVRYRDRIKPDLRNATQTP
jgi:hypothetical protein